MIKSLFKVAVASLCWTAAMPLSAQLTSIKDTSERDACLKAFDAKARIKKLSADTYKAAIEGVCNKEHVNARALYELSLEMDSNQAYLVNRMDEDFSSLKSRMVTSYIMGD